MMSTTISNTRSVAIGTLSNVSSENKNTELSVYQTVSAALQQTQPTTGSDHSAPHGTSLSKHYLSDRTKIINYIGDTPLEAVKHWLLKVGSSLRVGFGEFHIRHLKTVVTRLELY